MKESYTPDHSQVSDAMETINRHKDCHINGDTIVVKKGGPGLKVWRCIDMLTNHAKFHLKME